MNRYTILRSLLCLAAVLALTIGAAALAEEVPAAPSLALVGTGTAMRGEIIDLKVTFPEPADEYGIEIYDPNGEFMYEFRNYDETGDVPFLAARLEPGTYQLRAYSVVNGTKSASSDPVAITVTEYTGSEKVIIRAGKSTAYARENVPLSIYAPGMKSVQLFCDEVPDLGWGANENFWAHSIVMGEPGTYHFYAEAYDYSGAKAKSGKVAITWTGKGTLGEPQILNINQSVYPAGEDLTVEYAFGNAVGAEGVDIIYGYTLFYPETEYGDYIYDTEALSQSGSFTIPGELLEANRSYSVQIYTYTKEQGYFSRGETVTFFAAPGNDRDLSLTVDGSSEIYAMTHEWLELNIHAPGATAIHLFKGREDDWDYWGDSFGFYEDIPYDWEHYKPDTLALYLEVCYDEDYFSEDAVWYYSDPLIVHVQAENGYLPSPVFTVPERVTIGEVLDIEVTELDENANGCWADVYAVNDEGNVDWHSIAKGNIDGSGHIYLPTAMLKPDTAYVVYTGCYGVNWIDSPCTQLWFTAVGEETDAAQFTLVLDSADGRYTTPNFTPFTALGYVPGAKELRVYGNGNEDEEWGRWDGDSFNTTDFKYYHIETFTLTLAARFVDDWEDVATAVIDSCAPNGEITYSTDNLPHEISAGEQFTVTLPDCVELCHVNAWREHDNWWWWDRYDEGNTTVIPGEFLDCEDIYHIQIDAQAPGYAPLHIEDFVLAVTGDQQSDITISVTESVLTAQRFNIEVDAPGATAVSWWIPNWNEEMARGSHIESENEIRWPGEFMIYARACYEPIDWRNFDRENWREIVNWGPISAVKLFTVEAPNGKAGIPEVTGVPEAVNWGETIRLTVSSAEHATWYDVRVHRQEEEGEYFFQHLDGPGSVDFDTTDLTPGDYFFHVYIAGETGYAEQETSVNFAVIGKGECGVSNAALATNSVNRGEMLSVTVPQADHAVWYDVRINDQEWNEYFYIRCYEPGTYLLPTANLYENGVFFVNVSTGAPGYYWNDSKLTRAQYFTVKEGAGGVFVGKHDVLTNEALSVSVYAPGAERIRVSSHYDGENDPKWWDGNGWETDTWQDTVSWEWAENGIHIRAEGLYDGVWRLIGQEQIVNVTFLEGYNYNEEYLRSLIPLTIKPGQDLSIEIPAGVDGIWAQVWDDTNWGEHIYFMNSQDKLYQLHDVDDPSMQEEAYWEEHYGAVQRICIPARFLKEGHLYRFDLGVWGGLGVNRGDVYARRFTVVTSTKDSNVKITVNGSTNDQTFQLCENYSVHVTAPGACAIRAYNGRDWDYRAGEEGWYVWSDGDDGAHVLFAQACYEDRNWDGVNWDDWDLEDAGLTWGGVSNKITLTYYGSGHLDRPAVSLASDTVNYGDFIVAKITNYDPEVYYSGTVFRLNDNGDGDWPTGEYEGSGDTVKISTIDLEPGEYYVRVNCGGKVGFYGNNNDGEEPIVTVVDNDEPTMTFSKGTVEVNERFWNAIRVPGADEFTMTVNEPGDWVFGDWENVWQFGPFDGEITQGEGLRFDHQGDYTLKLYARYNGGDWQYTGVTKTLYATANVTLDLWTLVPVFIDAGDGLTINLPGATDTWAHVYDDTVGGKIYWMDWDESRPSSYNYFDTDTGLWAAEGRLNGENGNVVIPAQYLKANHTYHIDYHAYAQGLDAEDAYNVRFTVVNQVIDNRVTITVPDVTDVYPGQDYTPYVSAPGSDEIIIFCNQDAHWRGGEEADAELYLYYDEGTYTVWAIARFGDEWSGRTEMHTVTFHNQGQLAVPPVDVSDTAVKGENLQFQIGSVPGSTRIIVDVWEEGVGGLPSAFRDMEGGNGTVSLMIGEEYQAGTTYRYSVRAEGRGYDANSFEGSFTVRNPEMDEPTFVLPAFLKTIEDEAFFGISAEVIRVPDGAVSIGSKAFAGIGNLRQIYIPASVTSIAPNAFDGDDVVIFGKANSYAETYAGEHVIIFVPVK